MWPAVNYEQWRETCDTLHAHTQVLGKLAARLAPAEPQLQHAALRLTARGWETSPLPALSQPSSDAVVWMFSISIATEPATPTAPPPAPLVADAPSTFRECVSASMVAPCALTVLSGGARASFVTRT